MSRKCI